MGKVFGVQRAEKKILSTKSETNSKHEFSNVQNKGEKIEVEKRGKRTYPVLLCVVRYEARVR